MNIKHIAVKIGRKVIERNPEVMAKITRSFLNRYFKNLQVDELEQSFEQRKDLTELLDTNIDKLRKFSEEYGISTTEIKQMINDNLHDFDISWILEWWKKDQNRLYGCIINHPQRMEFETWIVEQVFKLADKIKEKL
jgi:hypothetical protein